MIDKFSLKSGRSPNSPSETITATPITVFVGPNNSGKSRVLQEINQYCKTGIKDANSKILKDISFIPLKSVEANELISRLRQNPNPDEPIEEGQVLIVNSGGRTFLPYNSLLNCALNPNIISNIHGYCRWLLANCTLLLDGKNRMNLINIQDAGDLKAPPRTSFQVLFQDDNKRNEVRRIIYEAIGQYFVLDPTFLGRFRIGLSDRPPTSDIEEKGITSDAVSFHKASRSIDLTSDGIKAFTGIITEMVAGDPNIILIDEPEAFLHPSLAALLGKEIASSANKTDKRVFASTHSPQFVMGCIQSGSPVTIIRLTYRGGIATARILPGEEILELMRHPLLRSTGLLSGLFYEFVVVTESDADRAFYQEVNERLLQFDPKNGIPNCLFINAQNKQTLHTLLRPLRNLGIPAAGIVDIDVLKDGGKSWVNILQSSGIPVLSHGSYSTLRAIILKAMSDTGKDMKKDGGINLLSGQDLEAADNLLNTLDQYGMFVVRGGELESWMNHLQVKGHGPDWLIEMFTKMGEDPNDMSYVKPSNDDVWKFISNIRKWLTDPCRKGIPS